MELVAITIITILIISIIGFLTNSISLKELSFEERLYKIAGFSPYKAYKVEFSKTKKKPDGIYFQYNNGCILYSIINIGYLDDKDIPSSMKYYKNHNYSKDDKAKYEDILKRILSLIDLAQLWINIGGIVPYKEKGKEIALEEIKNRVFDISYILSCFLIGLLNWTFPALYGSKPAILYNLSSNVNFFLGINNVVNILIISIINIEHIISEIISILYFV